jgi:hydrogenase maturation protease
VKTIGVGNPWRHDDAAGLEVARRLGGRELEDVAALVEALGAMDEAVIVDSVSSGAAPGTIHRFEATEAPLPLDLFAASTHVLGVGDAVELARALGKLPARVTVYGIEGADFSAGEGLSPEVERAVADVVREVKACTRRR